MLFCSVSRLIYRTQALRELSAKGLSMTLQNTICLHTPPDKDLPHTTIVRGK